MRKGFKKVLSIALCAAMMGTMLTACGGGGKKDAAKKDNKDRIFTGRCGE